MTTIKITILFILTVFLTLSGVGQETKKTTAIIYVGRIDIYPIELEINTYDYQTGVISGRYKYVKQNKYIEIIGTVSYPCIHFEESYKGKVSGNFYVEMEPTTLNGFWTSATKTRKVELAVKSGDISKWKFKTLEDLSFKVTNSINGSYGNESYWINDYFATPDNPSVEIGFNGGYAVFKKVGVDSLEFQLEVICGPTYHFAYAVGIAVKQDSVYKYISSEYASEDSSCEIIITFTEKQVHVIANQSMDCGFGARAYLDHYFIKISESTVMEEDVSLSTLKGK